MHLRYDNCSTNTIMINDFAKEIDQNLIEEKKGNVYKYFVEAVEKPLIEKILTMTKGNQLKAARFLGINRNTLRSKIKKLNIN